ncbi:hypothetical protein Dimus_019512 [Dionaea muscipula]
MEDWADETGMKLKHHPMRDKRGTRINLTEIEQEEDRLMVSSVWVIRFLLLFSVFQLVALCEIHGYNNNFLNPNGSTMAEIDGFKSILHDCGLATSSKVPKQEAARDVNKDRNDQYGETEKYKPSLKIWLKHRSNIGEEDQKKEAKESVAESTLKDMNRIHTFHRRIIENKNQDAASRLRRRRSTTATTSTGNMARQLLEQPRDQAEATSGSWQLMGSLTSGVSLGSGEYFMDVFVGTPPKHFLLIVDTGSDLNWIQCDPCHDCFDQKGPFYNPLSSTSYKNISCRDPRCHLVASPDPPRPCKPETESSSQTQTCPYFYWYGDSSNTTGDFSLETFTVNLTTPEGKEPEFKKVENVMFGCGHWNRGLFHGAAGLLGLGRGPLSFASQLQALYGHSFSYCLVDRNSDSSVTSKLIFGEDKDLMRHPLLNFTKLVSGKQNLADTFYYVQIESIVVGGDVLDIPGETWQISEDGAGGTIIDSGTTLSYFAEPAYAVIKDAFVKRINGSYPLVKEFPVLDPCYNVSRVKEEELELPEFGIRFSDGVEWNFPAQNYFIWVDQYVVCLAILGTPRSSFSIIGNYQQQNFHVLYDTNKSRLGFAPTRCADV